MKLKKYSFTLMEVMVAFAILSIVLSVIFSSIHREIVLKAKIETMEKKVMHRIEIQQYLGRIFANLAFQDIEEKQSTLYSIEGSEPMLAFIFDNGLEPNPVFCGILKGLLLIEKGHLVLKLHPGKKDERIHILKETINTLSFEFLTWGSLGVKTTSFWDQKQPHPPAFIKMTVSKEEEYVFWVNRKQEEGICLKGAL